MAEKCVKSRTEERSFFYCFIMLLLLVFLAFIIGLSLFYGIDPDFDGIIQEQREHFVNKKFWVSLFRSLANLFVFFIAASVVHAFEKKLSYRWKILVSLAFVLVGMGILGILSFRYIRMNPLYPSVDQKAVWEMGYYLVHPVGDIPSIYVPNYWLKFPYQKNLAVFLSVFIRVTGCDKDDYRYFQYLNVISILFLLLGITLLGSLRHPDPQNGKKSGSFSDGLLSAVMFLAYSAPLILYTSYVYPTLISLTATVYSFILLLVCINGKERLPAGWYGVILCGGTICMAFAIFVYSGSVIAAIALAIVAIGDGVKGIWHALVRYRHSFAIQKEKKNAASLLMKSLLEILSILLIFVLFRFGQNISDDLFLKKCNIDKSEGIPAITTVPMGISSDSEDCVAGPGSYDGSKEFVYKHFNYDTYQTSKYSLSETKKIVGEYLSGKRSLTFFIRKTVYQWCDPWFSGISMANEGTLLDSNDESIQKLAAFEGFLSGSLNRHIHEFLTALLTAYYMAAFISGIVSFKKPDATTELLVIYFIGGFVFQLFWESKARYCLPYFILSIPIAASGIMKLVSYKRNAGD